MQNWGDVPPLSKKMWGILLSPPPGQLGAQEERADTF